MDVSRALLLPDLGAPQDQLLKNLALYWDGLVVPVDRSEGALFGGDTRPETATYAALRDVYGILSEVPQPVPLEDVVPPIGGPGSQLPGTTRFLAMKIDDDNPRFDGLVYMTEEQAAAAATNYAPYDPEGLATAAAALFADIAFRRLSDARELAASKNLAPLAYSLVGHVGSLAGPENADVPIREAALISATIQAFEIDADVELETVAKLRDKHGQEIARLRASLTDLAAALDGGTNMDRLMAQARDVVRNRVEPALGDLESVLKENRIKYMLKSALGVSTLTVGAIQPVAGMERAGALTAQTLDYRFSREALVRQHPYGFLHRVESLRPGTSTSSTPKMMSPGIADPHHFVRELIRQAIRARLSDSGRD